MTRKEDLYIECSILKLQLFYTQLDMVQRQLDSKRLLGRFKDIVTDKNISALLKEIDEYTTIKFKSLEDLLVERQNIIDSIKIICEELMELDPKYTYFISFFTKEELNIFSKYDADLKRKYLKMKIDEQILKVCGDYDEYRPTVKNKKEKKKNIDIFSKK